MEARLAAQIEVVTKALLKRTPSAARLSITGVLMIGCPAQPSVSFRWSSTSRKSMLGLLVASSQLSICEQPETAAAVAIVIKKSRREIFVIIMYPSRANINAYRRKRR
jgi:hypothetical protein